MGIQSFFKQRKPRKFEHKLIYWDPKKEELEQRVARIRQEMIASGELPAPEDAEAAPADSAEGTTDSYDAERQVRGSFLQSTRHLQRQHKQGVTSADREQRMIRLMLALLVLGFAFWFFFLR